MRYQRSCHGCNHFHCSCSPKSPPFAVTHSAKLLVCATFVAMDVAQRYVRVVSAFNENLQAQYDYSSRVQLVLSLALLSAAYLHLVVRRLAPGFKSLMSTIPVILINIWAPMVFSSRTELLTRVILGLLLFWLGNFKAVGLCLKRGPLASSSWNLLQVFLLYIGPIYPRQDGPVKKGRLSDSAGPTSKLFSLAAGHAVMLCFTAYALAEVPLPMTIKHYVYGHALCNFISFLMNGPAAVLTGLAELDVVPPFDKPWMSTSLADFWGRRWNNTVGLTLRAVIYDPIVEGCWIHREPAGSAAAAHGAAPAGPEDAATQSTVSQGESTTASDSSSSQPASSGPAKVPVLKRLAGTAATFAVSGLMHELILLYALHEGNSYPAGFWFMFFFIQVPLLVLETVVRRRLRKAGIQLARPVAIGGTTAVLLISAYFFWFPPVEEYTDVALRVVTSVNESALGVARSVQGLLQQLGLHLEPAVGGTAFVGSVTKAAL